MYTIDDCAEYLAVTAMTKNGLSTCCDAAVEYSPDLRVETCVDCGSFVVTVVS